MVPHKQSQLTFGKVSKANQWRKYNLFTKWFETIGYPHQRIKKELQPTSQTYAKIDSKWIMAFNVECKTIASRYNTRISSGSRARQGILRPNTSNKINRRSNS